MCLQPFGCGAPDKGIPDKGIREQSLQAMCSSMSCCAKLYHGACTETALAKRVWNVFGCQ